MPHHNSKRDIGFLLRVTLTILNCWSGFREVEGHYEIDRYCSNLKHNYQVSPDCNKLGFNRLGLKYHRSFQRHSPNMQWICDHEDESWQYQYGRAVIMMNCCGITSYLVLGRIVLSHTVFTYYLFHTLKVIADFSL
ncbi:hypothetical protein ROZALSC1DRAFT_22348 [Rozella allomycis CSF55]|uniref:Uncharacterized protein n=1 Tax=Rozella allomycis (strain CSF55) TaxID=988480 RepID=A0A4P9YJT4_ROZAC|nr:hypothetical protein ROZALSC1DRAFT_22348 [Rozella allomycis CSF55]